MQGLKSNDSESLFAYARLKSYTDGALGTFLCAGRQDFFVRKIVIFWAEKFIFGRFIPLAVVLSFFISIFQVERMDC